jgi:hypothetical protein
MNLPDEGARVALEHLVAARARVHMRVADAQGFSNVCTHPVFNVLLVLRDNVGFISTRAGHIDIPSFNR